ncbi:MAG: hypothetical protein ACRD4B_02520, partial [Acidobacteriota bacterium]
MLGFYLGYDFQRTKVQKGGDNSRVLIKNRGVVTRDASVVKNKIIFTNAIFPFAELRLGKENIQLKKETQNLAQVL